MIRLDVQGVVVSMEPTQAERLRLAAATQAGSSSRLRDLSLVLDWALGSSRVVALRRSEARELLRLVQATPELADIADVLEPLRLAA
jgi:hypothetical protein